MVRQAAINALDSWVEHTKLSPFVEDGVFAESLRTENPNLRSTVRSITILFRLICCLFG